MNSTNGNAAGRWVALGGIFGALGIIAGAFAAHALRDKISPEMMDVFQTGARYQMFHALALVGIGALLGGAVEARPDGAAARERAGCAALLNLAGWACTIGIVIFSGSLYALAHGAPRWCGMITPFGGLAFIAAWGLIAAAGFKMKNAA